MLLEIKGLNFNYPDKEIFQSFDLKAPPGKILHLNGPSGAGKTTLLHLIAGIQSPQSGAITLGEEVFYDNKQKLLIEERRVGLVFQDYALFPHLNVIKNISFGNKNITEEKINKALHQLDINKLKNKYPNLNKIELETVLNIFTGNIAGALKKGNTVEIRGLGRWYFSKLKENFNARNPATNELIYKPGRLKVRFRPSKKLKQEINE